VIECGDAGGFLGQQPFDQAAATTADLQASMTLHRTEHRERPVEDGLMSTWRTTSATVRTPSNYAGRSPGGDVHKPPACSAETGPGRGRHR
jgi:hypothetical protein